MIFSKRIVPILLLTLIACTSQAQLNKAYFFYKGEEFLSKGQYSRALPFLNTLISIDSTLSEGWFLRGVAKYNLGDVHGAVSDFQKSTDVNPLFSQAYNYKAIALNRLSRHNQAFVEIKNALELKPNSTDYQYTLGVTHFYLKEYKKAVEVFTKMIMFDKSNPDAWINRGTARMLTADTLGALSDFDRAIVLSPFSAFAYFKRGALYMDRKNYELAISDLNQSILLDSTAKEGYFVRAIAYYEMKQPKRALADLNRVVALDPNYSLGLFNRAIIAYQMGNWQDAVIDLTRLTALNPENVLIYYNRGLIQSENGRLREALNDYTTAINIFPDFANAYINRSQVKHRLGDIKGSEQDYVKGNELMNRYKHGAGEGMLAMLDSSGALNKLISLESDFNTASRFNMKSNRVKVASAFLPLAKLWVVGADGQKYHESGQNEQWLKDLNQQLPPDFKLALVTDVQGAKTITVERVDSLLRKNPCYNLMRGIAFSCEGKYAEANKEYEIALSKAPPCPLLRMTYIASEADMAQFIEGFSHETMSINSAAESKRNQQTMTAYNDAVGELLEMQRQYPNNAYILYNLANMYVLANDYNEAISWYDRALTVNRSFPSARYNRGLALLLTGVQAKGCEDLSIAGEQGVKQAYDAMKRFCEK